MPGPGAIRGRVSCHTGFDLVKGVAFQRLGHRPIHAALREAMGGMVQRVHRRVDEIAVGALCGMAKLSDC